MNIAEQECLKHALMNYLLADEPTNVIIRRNIYAKQKKS